MTPCCALGGPCDQSRRRGGPGCYLCDTVSQLPAPQLLDRASKYAQPKATPKPTRDPRFIKRKRKPLR